LRSQSVLSHHNPTFIAFRKGNEYLVVFASENRNFFVLDVFVTAGARKKRNETMTPKERDQRKDKNRYGFSFRVTANHISTTQMTKFRFFQFARITISALPQTIYLLYPFFDFFNL